MDRLSSREAQFCRETCDLGLLPRVNCENIVQMYLFRNGKPSANPLALIAACESLAQQYRLVKTFTLEPDGRQVMVFVRPPVEQAQK